MDVLKDTVVAKKNKTGNASSFFMFYDAFQLVSLRASDTAELPRVIRDADCKLTLYKKIKPELIFVDPNASPEDYSVVVAARIGKLREDFSASEIVVLSCSPYGDGHSRLERKLTPKGDNGRMFNQAYRFSTYRKFKGLDAPVVVLVDVDRNAFVGAHDAMPFYEGASRARLRLVVFASMSDEDCSEVVAAYSGKADSSDCARAEFADIFCMLA